MTRFFCLLIISALATSLAWAQSQAERYTSGEEPTLPEPIPATYRDYQVLPGSLSPDQHYALLYPKRLLIYSLSTYGLFLVTFRPFTVLCQLPLGHSNLCRNARCYYACQWAANSSAVVLVAGSRWRPERVSAVSLRNGRLVCCVELTSQVRRLVREDFVRSGAKNYNDYYDFVFSECYLDEGRFTEIPLERGWEPDTMGRVHVNCVCTNNPKLPGPKDWTVHFSGEWDLNRAVFVERHFNRTAPLVVR